MSKPPAFQFYANDFMDITRLWDANAVGLHVRCMCIAWTHGSIPSVQKVLARAIHCDLSELQACWPTLSEHWTDNGAGGLVFAPLEAVRVRQQEVRAARKAAADKRWADANAHANVNANAHAKKKQRKVKEKIEGEEEGEVVSEPREKKSADLPFASEAFAEAWANWEGHRRAKRSTLTPQARSAQLAKCAEWGEARASAALKHSTANGYTGLFEPTSPPKQTPNERHQSGVIGRNDTIETSLRS